MKHSTETPKEYMARLQALNDEAADEHLDTLLGIMLVLIVVMVCAFALGLVYQMAGPWIAELLTAVWGWVK